MREITLEEAWELCLEQWDFIAAKGYRDVVGNKKRFIDGCASIYTPGFRITVTHNCFFCEYHCRKASGGDICAHCPGKLVNSEFDCAGYSTDPRGFHRKLRKLNKKRLKQGAKQDAYRQGILRRFWHAARRALHIGPA